MTPLDICCLIISGLLLIQGLWYGFLKGLLFIIAWGAAIVGAYFSNDLLSDAVKGSFNIDGSVASIVCIAVGFLVPFLLFSILGRVSHHLVSKSILSLPNRLLGGLVGAFKAVIACSLILTIVHFLPLVGSWKTGRQESVSYQAYLYELDLLGIDHSVPELKSLIEDKAETASDGVKEAVKDIRNESVEKMRDSAKKVVENVAGAVSAAGEAAGEVAGAVSEAGEKAKASIEEARKEAEALKAEKAAKDSAKKGGKGD